MKKKEGTLVQAALLGLVAVGLTACSSSPPPVRSSLASHPEYLPYKIERAAIIRIAANGGASPTGNLAPGDVIDAWVQPMADNWYRITLKDGRSGYVFGTPWRRE